MYETNFPVDVPRKVRALLVDDDDRLVLLQRKKPRKAIYHVTAGGKMEPGETKREALVRELHEELDAEVVLGQSLYKVLDTTYFAARLINLGPKPFTGPEFTDKRLGQYAIVHLSIADVVSGRFDLQPRVIIDFLRDYEGALLAEINRLRVGSKWGVPRV